MSKDEEKEYIKIKVKRSYLAQTKTISSDIGEDFEKTFNRIYGDGLTVNQTDFMLKNELMKVQHLDKKLLEIYPFLRKTYRYEGSSYAIFDKIMHFYVDLASILLKKNFRELDILVLSKSQNIFNYLKDNYPDDYKEIKSYAVAQGRTKRYKALFSINSDLSKFQNTSHVLIKNNSDLSNEEYIKAGKMRR